MFKEIAEINRIMEQNTLGPLASKQVICLATALSVSYGLELPSSEVESLKNHYLTNFDIRVKDRVSEINEHIAVDVPGCLDLIYRLYEIRYNAVYKPQLLDLRALIDSQAIKSVPPSIVNMDDANLRLARHIALTYL